MKEFVHICRWGFVCGWANRKTQKNCLPCKIWQNPSPTPTPPPPLIYHPTGRIYGLMYDNWRKPDITEVCSLSKVLSTFKMCRRLEPVQQKYYYVNWIQFVDFHPFFTREINSVPLVATLVVCWQPLQTFWTQIRPNKTSGLTWIQTVWHSDGSLVRFFWKS